MTNNQLTSTHLAVKSELDGYKIHASRGQATAMAMVRLFESIDRDLEELQERRKAAAEPVVPATLPCSVELKPGLIIGKGCKTETLLVALQRRADYYAELDAMTPEERAERDANIAAFKTMLPQPALVVPDGYVMVPVEPNGDMLAAAQDAYGETDGDIASTLRAAMLAAAPQEVK
ncbi:TPA: hypothetical protein RRG99_003811 [Klebsiella pneumoniae]|nr:hypothetical protein [Klebsiella pneumoniae]